eukprot:scaffold541_cov335-Pavlova_lutheri.AAC.5
MGPPWDLNPKSIPSGSVLLSSSDRSTVGSGWKGGPNPGRCPRTSGRVRVRNRRAFPFAPGLSEGGQKEDLRDRRAVEDPSSCVEVVNVVPSGSHSSP